MRTRTPRHRAVLVAVTGALVVTLAACGSNLDPADVSREGTVAAGGTTVDPLTGETITDPGSVDPGTGSAGDPAAGGTGTTGDAGGPPAAGGDTGGDTGGGEPPVEGPSAADCEGFKNGPGVTDDTITIGNSSDVSGPVPGIFETARDGTEAFVAYFNATVPDGICGRKLALKTYDSRTDAAADQQAYAAACAEVFAMVGSQSAFDSGGARTAQECGLPDIRAGGVTADRNACTTCYPAQAVNTAFFENAVPDFVKKEYGSSASKAGYLYTNAGAAAENAKAQVNAMERRGLTFKVVEGIDIAEFNYVPYVQRLKDEGVEVVFFTSSYEFSAKLRQTMAQQGYKPKLYLRDPTDYNPAYVEQGGSAVDGTVVYTNFTPFEEAGSNPEVANYVNWLGQVKPGAAPQFFGAWAWSAARLFVTLAAKLGGDLNRASLVAELRKVDNWTAEGLHAPQPVGSKGTGECWRFIQLQGSSWKPLGGTKYTCTGLTSTK